MMAEDDYVCMGDADCQYLTEQYLMPEAGKAESPMKLFYDEVISKTTLDKDVLDELISCCILMTDDRAEIVQSSILADRNKTLLDILLTRPYNTFTALVNVLAESDKFNVDVVELVNRMYKYCSQPTTGTLQRSHQRHTLVKARSIVGSGSEESVNYLTTKDSDLSKIQIQKNYKTIVHKTDCSTVVLDYLIAENIMSHEDSEEISIQWNTRNERNRKLLGKLLKKDDRACYQFLKALRLDEQYIDIANQIEATEVSDDDKSLIKIGLKAAHERVMKQAEDLDRVIPMNIQEQYKIRVEKWEKEDRKFVPTRAATHVLHCIKGNSSVTVIGHSGSGKSFIVHHVALKMKKNGYFIVPIKKPEEMKQYYIPGRKMLFVIDDVCGRFTLNQHLYNNWKLMLDEIMLMLDDVSVKIISSCRLQVFRDDKFSVLSVFKLCECNISSPELRLSEEETTKLAEMYFKNRSYKVISIFGGYDFYPLLCQLYSKTQVPFFDTSLTNPFGILQEDLDNFLLEGDEGKLKYCGLLLCVLFYNTLVEDDFAEKADDPAVASTLAECGLNKGTPGQSILKAMVTLKDVFITVLNKKVQIIHDKLFDFLSVYFAKKWTCHFIKHSHPNFVRERFICGEFHDDEFRIKIPSEYDTIYLKRMLTDWANGYVVNVFSNINMKSNKFRKRFMSHLDSEELSYRQQLFQTKDRDNLSTALLQVCAEGFVDLLNWIMYYTQDINCTRKDGVCPLYIACEHGHISIVKELVRHSEIDVNKRRRNNVTPLMAAAFYNRPNIIDELLKNSSVDINAFDDEGRTAIFRACLRGNTAVVRQLLRYPVDLSKCKQNGASPLYVATEFGYLEIVQELLKHSIDVNMMIQFGGSPLHAACYKNEIEVVKELLKHKQINVNICAGNAERGKTPLYVACSKGFFEIAKSLLDHPQIDVNKSNVNGTSPLYIACSNGYSKIVKSLLEHPKIDVNQANANGASPLFVASQEGYLKLVKYLIENSADMNQRTLGGDTALSVASQNGHVDVTRELINYGYDVNICSAIGESPLFQACKSGHINVAIELLRHSVDINLRTAIGETPLFIACKNGFIGLVKEILLHNETDINACTMNGFSPVCIACQEGHIDIVDLLVTRFPYIAEQTTTTCILSPLYIACQYGQVEIAQLLLKHSYDINVFYHSNKSLLYIACQNGHFKIVKLLLKYPIEVNQCTDDGFSPFYIACANGYSNIVFELIGNQSVDTSKTNNQGESPFWAACAAGHFDIVCELLYGNVVAIDESNNEGKTPLFIACQNGHIEVVRELINYHADINKCSQSRVSPLHIACSYGRVEIVKELISRPGIDLDPKAVDGDSPLHKACRRGHLNIVSRLLQHAVDINYSNEEGHTPLFLACERKHADIALELLNHPLDVGKEDNFGTSPLFLAIDFGMMSIVRAILQHQTDMEYNNRFLFLNFACRVGKIDILDELLRHRGTDVNICNDEKETLLFLSCEMGNLDVVKKLLQYSVDVNIPNIHGKSPLHVACEIGLRDLVYLLLQNNADVNMRYNGYTAKQIAKAKRHKQIMKMFKKKDRCTTM